MTRKRGEWWAKLSTKERTLRSAIRHVQGLVKHYKSKIPTTKGMEREFNIRQVYEYKAFVNALKHELVRGGTVKVRLNESGFYCNNCWRLVQRSDNYCSMCGKKLNWAVAEKQYKQHYLLNVAKEFLDSIKPSNSTNQKLCNLDRAKEMLDAFEVECNKEAKKNAQR